MPHGVALLQTKKDTNDFGGVFGRLDWDMKVKTNHR
jgi:hypothetical protein